MRPSPEGTRTAGQRVGDAIKPGPFGTEKAARQAANPRRRHPIRERIGSRSWQQRPSPEAKNRRRDRTGGHRMFPPSRKLTPDSATTCT